MASIWLPFTWDDLQGLELPSNCPAALEDLRCLFRIASSEPGRMSLQAFVSVAFRPYVGWQDRQQHGMPAKVGHVLYWLTGLVPETQRQFLYTPFEHEGVGIGVDLWREAWAATHTSRTGKSLIPLIDGTPPTLPEC